MWYQLSPFTRSNVAIAMQHHQGNIHQSFATPRYPATPCYILIQSPNVIDTYRNDNGVRKPSMLHLPTSFPKQILTPSRVQFIEGSLKVKLPTIWTDGKAKMGRVREEKTRKKKIKKRKSQKKEDADARKSRKVAKHCVFLMLCVCGGSKSRLAKARRVRSQLAR